MNSQSSLWRADYLSLHALLLLGYALFGKLFAYQGVAPLYVGEVALILGTCGFLLSVRRWMALKDWVVVPLVLYLLLGAVETVPDVMEHGILALRDAVIWGYGWFAILVFTILRTQPRGFQRLLAYYARFCRVAIVLVPVVWLMTTVLGVIEFDVGGRPVLILKGAEILVHACGILAFLYAYERRLGVFWLFLLPVFFVIGMNTRAGLLSVLGTVATLQLLQPPRRRWLVIVGVVVIGLGVMALTEIRIPIPGSPREISFEALSSGLASVIQDTGNETYDGTKRWRLTWWQKIVDYTLRGDYFWTGKGFGVNLADVDGFVLESSRALRSPHNGHLTVLARMGVPGLALWVLVQGGWACGMLIGYLRSRRNGQDSRARLHLFLLGYWVGFVVNASFDVFLEGPMAGIWFWTVYGAGLAAMRIPGRDKRGEVRSRPAEAAVYWTSGRPAGCLARS